MHLIKLELNNYRRFEEAEIEFPDGVVGIIGNNGAGKSSLVEAIAWVLYGNDVARSSKEEIKRLGASPSEVCRVILDFEMNGDNYRVVRELKGASNTADAALFVNGRPQARGVTATSELIERTLGMDWKSFLVSFFARQRELNALTEYQPAKRIEVLSRLLGIERIEGAIKKLRQDKRDSQTKLETTRGFVVDVVQLQQQIQLKQKEEEELKKQVSHQELQLKLAKTEFAKLAGEFELLRSKKENHDRLQKELEIKQSQLKDTEEQSASIQKDKEEVLRLIPRQKELKPFLDRHGQLLGLLMEQEKLKQKSSTRKSLEEQIKAHQDFLKQDQHRLQALQSDLTLQPQLQEDLAESDKKLIQLEQELEAGQKEYNLYSAQEKSFSDQVSKLQKQLHHIEELGSESVCDQCLRPLGKDFEQIKSHFQLEFDQLSSQAKTAALHRDQHFKKIQSAKLEKDKLQKQKEFSKSKLKQLEQAETERSSLEQRLSQSLQSLENFQRAYQELGAQPYQPEVHQRLQEELKLAETEKQHYLEVTERIKNLPNLENKSRELELRCNSLAEEIHRILTSLEQLQFNPADFQNREVALAEMRQKLHQAELNLKDLHFGEMTLAGEIKPLQDKIKENQILRQQIQELETESKYLEKLDLLMADFKVHLIGRIRPALSNLTKSLISEMTEGKYSEMELDDNYEIFICENGQKFGLERFSGGEKDLANLCLRLAISILMTQSAGTEFSFIVLDEIFGSQDQQRKENILKALGNLRNRFRQIILITHIEDIKDQVEALLQVTENPDGTSRVEMSLAYA